MKDIIESLAALHLKVDALTQRLNDPHAQPVLEPMGVAEFAKKIGRGRVWVLDRIASKKIKVLPCGKPYQIPPSDITRFFSVGGAK